MNRSIWLLTLLLFFVLSQMACTDYQPEKINYGKETCAYCKMNIVEKQYGTQLINDKGKKYYFDSIECLAAMEIKKPELSETVHSMWLTDFENPDRFINLEQAVFLYGGTIRSPMGIGLLSVSHDKNAQELLNTFGAEIVDWQQVKEIVKSVWDL